MLDSDRRDHFGGPPRGSLLAVCDLSLGQDVCPIGDRDFVDPMRRTISVARERNIPVAFCERAGFGGASWPIGLRDCRPRGGDLVFERSSASIFSNEEFRRTIKSLDIGKIYLAGIEADMGVLCSALDAVYLGVECRVLTDLCAGPLKPGDAHEKGYIGMLLIVERHAIAAESSMYF